MHRPPHQQAGIFIGGPGAEPLCQGPLYVKVLLKQLSGQQELHWRHNHSRKQGHVQIEQLERQMNLPWQGPHCFQSNAVLLEIDILLSLLIETLAMPASAAQISHRTELEIYGTAVGLEPFQSAQLRLQHTHGLPRLWHNGFR